MNKKFVGPMFVDLLMSTNLSDRILNNNEIVERCLQIKELFPVNTDWGCDTYNSLDSYNLTKDFIFKPLIDLSGLEVIEFAKEYGVGSNKVECMDAWFNIASPGDFQEFHQHPKSHFSVVYYANVVENSGKILFKSLQSISDMFPLPTSSDVLPDYKNYQYTPLNQDLLIFRSNIPHMVQKNKSNVDRISIAMNFSFV